MIKVVMTGGSSGLGMAIMDHLEFQYDFDVVDLSSNEVDVTNEKQVEDWFNARTEKIDILINCAGINRIDYLPNAPMSDWDDVMNTNARAIFLTAKYALPYLRDGTILNIVSNASHVPMTCSAAYNASKAAAAMLTKQLSRELIKTHGITVFAISPNKLCNTKMSEYIDQRVMKLRGWSAKQARDYQLAALPAGEETDPKTLAEFVGFLLSTKERHKYLAGCDIPYGL